MVPHSASARIGRSLDTPARVSLGLVVSVLAGVNLGGWMLGVLYAAGLR